MTSSKLKCIVCGQDFPSGRKLRCNCGELLEAQHEFPEVDRNLFDKRSKLYKKPFFSGVWRFKELIHPNIDESEIITKLEGNTNLYSHSLLNKYTGINELTLKHEGENPTGSFKDRGMTVGISEAKRLGIKAVACASTGNTSSSLAAYAAQAGLDCFVFIPEGEISHSKLVQTISYGAKVVQIKGNFDDSMRIVQEVSEELEFYLLNSVNPWRIEGQKTIIFELIHQMEWKTPDWIVVPAGNLGNTSAFGKALMELQSLDLIHDSPRIASIQAEGANPFYEFMIKGLKTLIPKKPDTIASAIKIGNPVNWRKALNSIKKTGGIVGQVSDQEIMDAKAIVDRSGIGCEPASAASVAGAKKLLEEGVIDKQENVACILTGNILKDPESSLEYHMGRLKGSNNKLANPPIVVQADPSFIVDAIRNLMNSKGEMLE